MKANPGMPPLKWIKIPAGKVTLLTQAEWRKNYIPEGSSQVFHVRRFEISKYPITNAQYRAFIEAGGYHNQQWWTTSGWDARLKGLEWEPSYDWKLRETDTPWTQPRYWDEREWNGDDLPVIGVSWHECIAFCQWLSEVTGDTINLPSEQQWQRAAQGDDNRAYPWGDQWDASRSNHDAGSQRNKKTTPVTQYEGKGDSPFGVVDMMGNVWEWCLTAYETGFTTIDENTERVMRGGCWYNSDPYAFRCSFRTGYDPNLRDRGWGFRIVRSK